MVPGLLVAVNWSESLADANQAWVVLSYRLGQIWRHELNGKLSHADFEQFWHDWKASRQLRAATS